MPGYQHQVIMAAARFCPGLVERTQRGRAHQAAVIAYMQAVLTYQHIKLASWPPYRTLSGEDI
jgi:cystathionine beta-lyase family protein involved in aluminum resistance